MVFLPQQLINEIMYSLTSEECAELIPPLHSFPYLKNLLNAVMTGFHCLQLKLSRLVGGQCGGVGTGQVWNSPPGGLTFEPVLERDPDLSSNTILIASSLQWLPAATHNEALCLGLCRQKGPLERWLPSGGLSPLFPLYLRLPPRREENSITEKDTMAFGGHLNPQLTVSTSVASG